MPVQKPKKVGRPKLAKGEAKGKIVPVRFNTDDLKKVTAAAKASKQTLSEWIRITLNAALLQKLAVSNLENGSRSNDSREIRKELRRLGHEGGLRSKQ